jgi:hypothetical protein
MHHFEHFEKEDENKTGLAMGCMPSAERRHLPRGW